ncbi:MAG: hypothetical protein WHS44_11615 [Fimbriimonadales bacterium]|nr:MAG: hypothetical protein KatS3mg018_0040 [Fimbriimonadales bacterium]
MRTLWLVGLAAVVSLGSAQTRTQRGATQQEDGRVPIAQAAQELARKFSVQIVVDPALTLRVNPPKADDLERALDEMTAQARDVVWRKVYTNKVLGAEPNAEQIISAVRALITIELGGVMVVNPRAATLNSFVANYPAPPDLENTLEQMQPPFSAKPVYVILNPKPQSATALRGSKTEQFAQMQQQLMDLLAKMSPEERQQALQSAMSMWMNADPNLRNQMIFEGMRMSFEYWQTLSPEQQREMMEMGRKFFEQYFGGGGMPDL